LLGKAEYAISSEDPQYWGFILVRAVENKMLEKEIVLIFKPIKKPNEQDLIFIY